MKKSAPRFRLALVASVALQLGAPCSAQAQDVAAVVAKARDQIDNGNFQDGLRTLSALKGRNVPPQLAIEAGLLETTALLVQGPDQAGAACGRAVIAAGYDPEIARDLSPKVRDVCRAAAKKVRGDRLSADKEKVAVGELALEAPEVAYKPVRISTTVDKKPSWLRMVARVESSGLEGTFDVPLIPSDEGPLLGTLDPSWIRPNAKLTVKLVAQDKFGDLGDAIHTKKIDIPAREAAVALGKIPSDATITVDGEKVKADAEGRVAATAGKHEVRLSLPSGAYAETSVELARGTVAQVALSPQQQSPSRVLPWITTGTSLALFAAGGVLLINAQARKSELEDAAQQREPGTELPASDYATLKGIDDERVLFQNVGFGLLGGGGAVAVAALVLWLVPSGGGSSSAALSPMVAPGFVGVRGTF